MREALNSLTVTDKTNIFCFVALTSLAIAGIIIAKKMKPPVWKFQIAWICFIEALGVFFLISRLIGK